jgi:8-oxo-dGTP pyrophosphatase MutT (NUDIX family)
MLSGAASDDQVTMDAWKPERPSASKSASARGFVRRSVQDSANPRAFPRGTPEPEDSGLIATLAREAFEENQVRVGATAYLGFQEVHRPGRAPYAQVRMTGVIQEFAPRAPDPDGGRVYRRLMTSLAAAPEVLGWGPPAVAQARAAGRVARQQWGVPVDTPAGPGYMD